MEEDIKSLSSIVFIMHELIGVLENKNDKKDKALLKRAKAFVDELASAPTTVKLPSWVRMQTCPKCHGECFHATLSAEKTHVAFCPAPIVFPDSMSDVYLDTTYLEFDGLKVRVMPGKMGLRWMLHSQVCGTQREFLPDYLKPMWDATYKEVDYSHSMQELEKVIK